MKPLLDAKNLGMKTHMRQLIGNTMENHSFNSLLAKKFKSPSTQMRSSSPLATYSKHLTNVKMPDDLHATNDGKTPHMESLALVITQGLLELPHSRPNSSRNSLASILLLTS
jgi:hypothetical protein